MDSHKEMWNKLKPIEEIENLKAESNIHIDVIAFIFIDFMIISRSKNYSKFLYKSEYNSI